VGHALRKGAGTSSPGENFLKKRKVKPIKKKNRVLSSNHVCPFWGEGDAKVSNPFDVGGFFFKGGEDSEDYLEWLGWGKTQSP